LFDLIVFDFDRPNETKKPKTLSKLSDPMAWEKRRTKGKIAVQRMVVNLMELYLHRLKLKRPPYPKAPGIEHFCAKFPYEPTHDQQKVSTMIVVPK
jgi:transcription-repair coupling factor (superfamily II helicase)